ncbi:UTRA domain-containing protein [Aquicoccus sp. SU-CL01552]|uniref:GntR family transcriptional regulator n=1 Tax=Aquicoccus sp. SU-CL01552 TaxID=3127656 RepID=UPI00310A6B11
MTERDAIPSSGKAAYITEMVRRRIFEKEWQQGDRIPDEAELAAEFGVARATVNKALQLLADEGLLDRRRRAGTRVAINPVRKATISIPIVREQIEAAGKRYSHRLISQSHRPLPAQHAKKLGLSAGEVLIHLRAVHYGDRQPFQLEDRWINPRAVPGIEEVDFHHLNANEWLVRNAPYLRADLTFSACNAGANDARLLETEPEQALLILNRTTWNDIGPITTVRLAFHPGYAMSATT